MNISEIKNDFLNEKYTKSVTDFGLEIYVCEKKEFSGAYAVFGTKYGSIDNSFDVNGKTITVPNGVAHFLEHKLFESEELDAFERYAKTGASANAYTSFDQTCYLFSCTANFYASFEILLDFVQHPYFTAQTVLKEQGIIGQEIQMYDDSSDWISMFNLLDCLYHYNPVKINIAGTKETIAQIDDKILYDCYNTFYNPQNMFIVVSGNVDTQKVLDMVNKLVLKPEKSFDVKRRFKAEPDEIVRYSKTAAMEVAMPQVLIGYKQKVEQNAYLPVKTVTGVNMMLDLVAGQSGILYKKLLDNRLAGKDFSSELMEGRGYGVEMFGGRTNKPDEFVDCIKQEIKRLQSTGIDEHLFESVKHKFIGDFVMSFNDVEQIGDMLVHCALTGDNMFDEFDAVNSITIDDINGLLKTHFDESNMAVSTVLPRGE